MEENIDSDIEDSDEDNYSEDSYEENLRRKETKHSIKNSDLDF